MGKANLKRTDYGRLTGTKEGGHPTDIRRTEWFMVGSWSKEYVPRKCKRAAELR